MPQSVSGIWYKLVKVRAIAGNTFRESVRQPVVLIILTAAVAMIAVSPYTTFFTLLESHTMIREMGLATLMLAGLLIAAFAATSVVSREIEDRTALSVLSKPISRGEFLLGKYLGVLLALLFVGYVGTLVLLLTSSVGGFEAGALQEVRGWVVILMVATVVAVLVTAAVLNYKKAWPFASTAVMISAPAFTLCTLVVAFVDYVIGAGPENTDVVLRVEPDMIMACILVMLSLMVIGAVAVAASTRLNALMTAVLCAVLFLLGLLSDFLFYPYASTHVSAWLAYALVPNLQVFWMGEAVAQGKAVPVGYVVSAAGYAACYVAGILFIGMLLFEDRQLS